MLMDVPGSSGMLMHVNGCQWTLFALTRWCGNKHGGHKWPRCLAAFANLGHLCTCRTSSLSPSQLRLKCSCSSWFSQRKPVMVCLNLEDAPKSWYPVADLGAENEAWDFEPLDVGVAIFERTPVVKDGWVGQGCSGPVWLLYSQNNVRVDLFFHLSLFQGDLTFARLAR